MLSEKTKVKRVHLGLANEITQVHETHDDRELERFSSLEIRTQLQRRKGRRKVSKRYQALEAIIFGIWSIRVFFMR